MINIAIFTDLVSIITDKIIYVKFRIKSKSLKNEQQKRIYLICKN